MKFYDFYKKYYLSQFWLFLINFFTKVKNTWDFWMNLKLDLNFDLKNILKFYSQEIYDFEKFMNFAKKWQV